MTKMRIETWKLKRKPNHMWPILINLVCFQFNSLAQKIDNSHTACAKKRTIKVAMGDYNN